MQNKTATDGSIFRHVAKSLRDLLSSTTANVQFHTLFYSKVKLYKKQPNGDIFSNMRASSISFVICEVAEQWHYLNGLHFLQCAIESNNVPSTSSSSTLQLQTNKIWIYPLLPGVSKYYRTNLGSFVLPDLECQMPGDSFGVVLVPTQQEALTSLQELFEELLQIALLGTIDALREFITKQQQEEQQQQPPMTAKANYIAENIIQGATVTNEVWQKSSSIASILPAPILSVLNTTVYGTLNAVKTVGGAALGAGGWLTGTVGSLLSTVAMTGYLTPCVQTVGTTLLQHKLGLDAKTANTAISHAVSVVSSAATIYAGMATSAKILGIRGQAIEQNSSEIVDTTNDFIVSNNFNYKLPKELTQQMINETGRIVLQEYKKNPESRESNKKIQI